MGVSAFLVFYGGIGLGVAWLLKKNQSKAKTKKAQNSTKEIKKQPIVEQKENRHE